MTKHGLYFPIVFDNEGNLVDPELFDSISASIRHILSWPIHWRYFLYSFGSGLHAFLGMPLSASTLDILRFHILLQLQAQESRLDVSSVKLVPHFDRVDILIEAYVKPLKIQTTFETSI